MSKSDNIKPFVKWVGGKRQLINEINDVLSKFKKIKNFHEPFVGGGAFFCNILNKGGNVASINDLNEDLINSYNVVKKNPNELIKILNKLESVHGRLLYYQIRSLDREKKYISGNSNIFRAARFLYLNKSCYNGLYRVNSKGEFNVPIGTMKKKLFDYNVIYKMSKSLNDSGTKIFQEDYKYILETAKKNDLVYFDPPYDSFENQNNFVNYQKEGFTRKNQEELKNVCDNLLEKGVNVIISNHNTDFIKKLYSNGNYTYKQINLHAKRVLSSKVKSRKKREIELLIYGGNHE